MPAWLLGAVALAGGLAAPQTPVGDAPIRVQSDELEAQRLAGGTTLRAANAPRRHGGSIILDVVIDENGSVASVEPLHDANSRSEVRRWYRPARGLVRQWRFRPIIRAGRPVRVRSRFDLQVLPPPRLPRRHIRFPHAAPQDVAITLERGGCFGPCPIYSVTVHGDGRVRFEGYAHTSVIGVRETTIPREAAERLIAQFRDGDFWSLDDRYRANITDSAEHRPPSAQALDRRPSSIMSARKSACPKSSARSRTLSTRLPARRAG